MGETRPQQEETTMKRAALHSLGCKVNSYETEAMQQMLEEAGYTIVPFHEEAELYLINTCSVTNIADRKSRQMIHRAKKQNPNAIVVAAGCYVQVSADKAVLDESIDIVIGNNKKGELLGLIAAYEQKRIKTHVLEINREKQAYEELKVHHPAEHTRAFLKVQDGCNQFCSYCIIPYARGRVRSRRLAHVVEEAGRLADNGFREIVLTGIHLSSYGVDLDQSLLEMIQAVHEIPGIERIRLGSLEPGIITEDFVRGLSSLEKVCPHFHLSLQSGCDTVLSRMNRRYTTAEYLDKLSILRRFYPHPALTTDVIVGFPGESEEEFAQTLDFVRRAGFYEIHVFKFSRRDGTRAASMANQLPEAVKARRSKALMALAEELKEEFLSWYQGKQVEVLFEEPVMKDGVRYYEGFTPEYVKVWYPTEESLENQIMKVEFLPSIS